MGAAGEGDGFRRLSFSGASGQTAPQSALHRHVGWLNGARLRAFELGA
jgi:hypothetical protein